MELAVGSILEGKVTGITKFGAFVSLPEGKSGLVHISEIAYSYVNDVNEHLKEGQEVKVKVIGIDETGRINLSIKKAMDPPPRPAGPPNGGFDRGPRPGGFDRGPRPGGFDRGPRPGGFDRGPRPGGFNRGPAAPKEPATFEDKLKLFMAASDTKLSEMKNAEKKGGNRRGGSGGGARK
ncbi:MAG: S1 RNA-binding domain-containing protein [Pseudoflavonifractor sp.]